MDCGLSISSLRPNTNPADGSGLWHSALKFGHLTRVICGTAIFYVAIHLENTSICLYSVKNLSLAIEWNPAPAIFHWETACLTHHIFLTRDFSSVKLIHGAMSRPKLYVNVLSWHNISWFYTFKHILRHATPEFAIFFSTTSSMQICDFPLPHTVHKVNVGLS
jgi:hypothetical protein